MLAGLLRDLAAFVAVIAPLVFLLAAIVPLLVSRVRTARWQRAAGVIAAAPFGAVVWALGIAAQEFKVERGAYPTVFDLSEGTSTAAFMKGTLGFLRYEIYWIPALVFTIAGMTLVTHRAWPPKRRAALAWRPWLTGLAAALALGVLLLRVSVPDGSSRGRFGASVVGDPFKAMIESAADWLAYAGKVTPRDLTREAKVPGANADDGAALLGWPPAQGETATRHPHARPLDRVSEPPIANAHGAELIRAFDDVSENLFPLEGDGLIVWQLTLESFRADDVHALNADAPREVAPFINGLYEAAARGGGEGVLANTRTYQAGVRTAQGLGALACGLGTLPYNLSIIRDLQPLPVRCLSDVLASAGFHETLFYGSDVTFDNMGDFFREHGISEQVTQAELPAKAPTGAWGAVTDLALVDESTRRLAASTDGRTPRFAMVTTLSNHSPFTAPADLPREVVQRVDHALATATNHASRADRPRLLTHSYTDAAVAHLFARLTELDLAARSIVVLAADHSTGEGYVWGPDTGEDESDDAKARIPFLIVLPPALRERARDRAALDAALASAQRALDATPLSQNDVPALLLSLLHAHPGVRAIPPEARFHTLGGQVTSPWFRPMPRAGAYLFGINGVSELVAIDRAGRRVGDYEESVFLKTRGDLSTVTPSLIPITATLSPLLRTSSH